MAQAFEMEANGFVFRTEARLVRADAFSGVFHVLSYGGRETFDPPVVVIVPGKWENEEDAHRAAQEYAVVMANDGALRAAVDLRQAACQ